MLFVLSQRKSTFSVICFMKQVQSVCRLLFYLCKVQHKQNKLATTYTLDSSCVCWIANKTNLCVPLQNFCLPVFASTIGCPYSNKGLAQMCELSIFKPFSPLLTFLPLSNHPLQVQKSSASLTGYPNASNSILMSSSSSLLNFVQLICICVIANHDTIIQHLCDKCQVIVITMKFHLHMLVLFF